jgi:hypothetical protein
MPTMRPTFAVYDFATSDDAGWPGDDETGDLMAAMQFKAGPLVAKLEPEDEDELRVYRDVLYDFEDMPLEDDDEQQALVDHMRAVIEATEAKFVAVERRRQLEAIRIIARAEKWDRDHPNAPRPRTTARAVWVPTWYGIACMFRQMFRKMMPRRQTATA